MDYGGGGGVDDKNDEFTNFVTVTLALPGHGHSVKADRHEPDKLFMYRIIHRLKG
jgi:hypothetical protein